MRGPLSPPDTRLGRTRSARFDEYVLESFERLERRWPKQLREVEVAVVDVPNVPGPGAAGAGGAAHSQHPRLAAGVLELPTADSPMFADEPGEVSFGRIIARHANLPTRIIIYRWPLERRARGSARGLADLVHMVVISQVAQLLAISQEEVDPAFYRDFDEGEDFD